MKAVYNGVHRVYTKGKFLLISHVYEVCTPKSTKKTPKNLSVLQLILNEILQIVLRGYDSHSVFPFYGFPVPGTRLAKKS